MEAHGVEIIYPDKQPFMDAAAPMIERFKNDPVFHDLIDQIQNTHGKIIDKELELSLIFLMAFLVVDVL